ncbi:MAG: right-handed parallel beta-helix repeat-containing protein [Thermoplasmatales archaeon]|nr:right-handed parallel beta-helix repeat-containing protein [Thermoplasmatales archaeon]
MKANYMIVFGLLVLGVALAINAIAHSPIHINGNEDFASQAIQNGWPGNGSPGNPYIIRNYEINALSEDGIRIENTNVYFMIRNCKIYNGKRGIYFKNVTNGIVENVDCYENLEGIAFNGSTNNQIRNSNFYNNHYGGIYFYYSTGNSISDCNSYKNDGYGIGLDNSQNNIIRNCNIYENSNGIILYSSNKNTIENCNSFNHYYYKAFYAFRSKENIIKACSFYNNSAGIHLYLSDKNSINNCNFFSNQENDLIFAESNNNDLQRCKFSSIFPTNLTINSYSGNLTIKGITTSPPDPEGWRNIGKYIEAKGERWANISIYYEDEKYEDYLEMLKYDGKEWLKNGWYKEKGINKQANYVWANITSFSIFAPMQELLPLEVRILKPGNALYIMDREIIPLPEPFIIGEFTVEATANSSIGIAKVEFYIDGVLKFNDTSEPYSWIWSDFSFANHEIKVVAWDNIGQNKTDKIRAYKIF